VASRKSAGKWKGLSQFPDVVLGKLGDLGTSFLPVHASETGSTNKLLSCVCMGRSKLSSTQHCSLLHTAVSTLNLFLFILKYMIVI
jgi:hypothetical protein